jgi:uncharacterized membrane protein (UPF0182 family)
MPTTQVPEKAVAEDILVSREVTLVMVEVVVVAVVMQVVKLVERAVMGICPAVQVVTVSRAEVAVVALRKLVRWVIQVATAVLALAGRWVQSFGQNGSP